MTQEIWMLARTTALNTVSTWYGYWNSEEEAHEYAQANAEGGDGTPCENLCSNKAEWFEPRLKTVEEIEEFDHVRVKRESEVEIEVKEV